MTRNARFSFILLAASAMPALAADIDKPIIGSVQPVTYADHAGQSGPASSVTGYVEGSFNRFVDTPYDVDGHTWALRGSVNIDAGEGLNFQFDAGYGRTSVEGADLDQLAGVAHVYHRDDTYAAGAFFQAGAIHAGALDYLGDDTITDYTGGLEAAWFGDVATLYGRAGYGQAGWLGQSADHYMGALGARLYVNDNLRFDIEGALHRLSSESIDLDTQSLSVSGNYRLDTMPVTVFAGYRYDRADVSNAGYSALDGNVGTVFAGLRFSFGSQRLKDEERNGPVWTASSLLP